MRRVNSKQIKNIVALAAAIIIAASAFGFQADAEETSSVKHIILMIGDGMGYNQVLAGSYYRFGEAGGQIYCDFPVQFAVCTSSASGNQYDPEQAWSDFDFVKMRPTDSAAAATAMATGYKTSNRRLGRKPYGGAVENVMERAEECRMSTGVVTNVPFYHATPAGFVAHNMWRYSYEDISREMITQSMLEVIMGAGHPCFDNNGRKLETPSNYSRVGGAELWCELIEGKAGGDADGDRRSDTWTLVQTREEFLELMDDPAPARVLGVAQVATTLQARRGEAEDGVPGKQETEPYQAPLNEGLPTLSEMSLGALNVLSRDEDGFVLMIEGGAIDWMCEDNLSARLIEEQVDFDKTVEAVVGWIESNSNWDETLLIVTSDHESGYLLGPGSNPERKPLTNNGKGKLPGMEWFTGSHSNSLVPIYAKGGAAGLLQDYADQEDPVRGRYIDNTEIAKFIFDLLDALPR